ncbi:hypothetical protein PMAYCL1PPCAC_10942, partial [Pristionchus mayeri]
TMDIDVDLTKRIAGKTRKLGALAACSVQPLTFIDMPCPVTVSCELPYRVFESTDSGFNVRLRCRFNGKLHDPSGNPIEDDVVCNDKTGSWNTKNTGDKIHAALCAL